MEEVKVREWLDKLVEAHKVIDEIKFLNPEKGYDEATVCTEEYIQIISGGHIYKIASLLGLEIITKPYPNKCYIERSFVYKGIIFLSVESLVGEDAGTD